MALYAFDGTWSDSSAPDDKRDTSRDTNVQRFCERYAGQVCYLDGVGTRFGVIGRVVGGASGAGAEQRIREQFIALQTNFGQGDNDIDVIGYSRGAAIARLFVHRLARDFYFLKTAQGESLSGPPLVRFLGLFDTVASFGIPWSDYEHSFTPEIPEFVENTFHAMALDETRETFGIERCLGDRRKITEVWFRGGHGDIGGSGRYKDGVRHVEKRKRTDIALNWMSVKARACGVPLPEKVVGGSDDGNQVEAPVTSKREPIKLGNVGTLSRRIHTGDLVHHTVERSELTRNVEGGLLRRIAVLTRLEDEVLEQQAHTADWLSVALDHPGDAAPRDVKSTPSLVDLSLRRYPFDILPARTWAEWLRRWELTKEGVVEEGRLAEFWAPSPADRALAWDIYVELQTRIATRELGDDEGDDLAALNSIYQLFGLSRKYMHRHGIGCANTGLLITAFLNTKLREFTAAWHRRSLADDWEGRRGQPDPEFREALKEIQPTLTKLAGALSHLADAKL
jgi:hypothetical protein